MIETILILDTETTGLSPAKGAKMIEVCAILYNLKHKQILQVFSTLLPTQTNEAQHINGIDPDLTIQPYPTDYLHIVEGMALYAQALVAHNAPFDREFLISHYPEMYGMRWICTQRDFPWPCHLPRRRLQDVCAGMGVDYVDAHRALSDTMFLVNCFNKIENLQDIFNSL
jgi:DNA polymerase-3 subunit epsilon